jgi:plastocyanin
MECGTKHRTHGLALIMGMLCVFLTTTPARAQQPPVTIHIEIARPGAGDKRASTAASIGAANDVAVWLVPVDAANSSETAAVHSKPVQLVQRNKTFEPHTLIVEVGTLVQFPNKDPFFHNVFSLFDGKRFDLGLYEAGSTNSVRFDRPGVSYLFCNIHAEMSAVVIAMPTPYYALSDRSGLATFANVPDGRYRLQVWYERGLPEELKKIDRVVVITTTERALGPIRVLRNPGFTAAHKNKYGEDYVPPNSTYDHP